MKCSKCSEELKGVPSGYSKKKGVAYDSFWGHKQGSQCTEKVAMSLEDAKKIELTARAEKLDSEMTRFKGMAFFNSLNAAIELSKEYAPEGKIKEFIMDYRNWLYEEAMEWFVKNVVNEE